MNTVRLDAHPPLCQQRLGGRLLARSRDGRVARGTGVLLLGGMLAGAVEWRVRGESDLVVFAWLSGVGAVLVLVGTLQWAVVVRRRRAAVAVTAHDPRGASDGRDHAEAAVHFCRERYELTFTVDGDLTGDAEEDWSTAQRMMAQTNWAIRRANRFKRDAARINLVPTMRLHHGFWLGAELGRSPSKPIGLLQPKGGGGDDDSYFLAAVVARPSTHWWRRWPARSPFKVCPEDIGVSDRPRVALVVRTQPRSAAADHQLKENLQGLGIDRVVWFRLKAEALPNRTRAFTQAVEQVRRVWPEHVPQTAEAEHVVYLDTTITVAMALGSYLAGPNPGLWTAYTHHRGTGAPIPFPPVRVGP